MGICGMSTCGNAETEMMKHHNSLKVMRRRAESNKDAINTRVDTDQEDSDNDTDQILKGFVSLNS